MQVGFDVILYYRFAILKYHNDIALSIVFPKNILQCNILCVILGPRR
nr:MAG TPA: hypothetical protein [Caudoviricetes sp.]